MLRLPRQAVDSLMESQPGLARGFGILYQAINMGYDLGDIFEYPKITT